MASWTHTGNYCKLCEKFCGDEEYCERCKDIVNALCNERSDWIAHMEFGVDCCGMFTERDDINNDFKCNECGKSLKNEIAEIKSKGVR